jgi:2-oxoisovalerate dehydrogenase E2 component (dihydrolipoyl transacylase)
MATFKDFNLPDLGEGLTEGEILKWLVAPGDDVTLNQPIVEVETAKAAVEIPSPYAGRVTTLHHGEGETVDVGSPIITFDTDPDGAGGGSAPPSAASAMSGAFAQNVGVVDAERRIQGGDLVPDPPNPAMANDVDLPHEPGMAGSPAPKAADEEKIQVLVGSGPKAGNLTRRPRKPAAPPGSGAAADSAQPVPPARVSAAGVGAHAARIAADAAVHVLAKPPVRKLARDLGVDLRSLTGTGSGGVITRDDVLAASPSSDLSGAQGAIAPRGPDNSVGMRGERIPIKGVRKATAAAMVASAFTAPHVTEFLTADVTPTMELVERLRGMRELRDVRVSPLLVVARALIAACRRYPMINSSWDEAAGEIVIHDAVNLGIAAATPRGLVVPNIKAADRLSLPELARALNDLVDTARAGKTPPADMQRGTITITNVGVFGVDTGTPILNPGEAAILCFGAVRPTPWVHAGEVAVRQVTQLALSFDHRIVDGQLGSEVLAMVGSLLADPSLFAVWS